MLVALVIMMPPSSAAESAKLVILGTGTPLPDPQSSGPAVAVIVNGQAYLFDAGPGVVRRAEAAFEELGIGALKASRLNKLFLTHLHTDHTLGYPDLIFTPWVIGRQEGLEVYGPKGTSDMTEHLKQAYAEDIKIRTEGFEHLRLQSLRVNVHEIDAGLVYRDDNVTIRAIPVTHGSWPQAFGYAIQAPARNIVISGDTAPCAAIVEACHGCDVLVHEVYSADRFDVLFGPGHREYHKTFHTSTKELAELASKAKPKLLVLYHQLYFGRPDEVDLEKEIRTAGYAGKVVNGHDLTAY